MEGFILKSKDELKLEIMYKYMRGEMSKFDAQTVLQISERTLRRFVSRYKKQGIAFVRHGNFQRAPINRTPLSLKLQVQSLVQERYFDFNVCHLREKLLEEFNINIRYETLRKWCHEINHVKRAKRRRAKPRFFRERMSQEGLMLQMDGSHHYWFGDRRLCLIAAIDDATNEVFARFYEGETTLACLDLLQSIVSKKGVFKLLYTDKAGVFGGIKREHFSQVERALGELGAQVIYAHSPQAKGRIERLFNTLQDRLVAELRLNGITTLEAANEFLEKVYLPHHHNPNNMVQAHNPVSYYRPLPPGTDLKEIFLFKEHRVVARDHTVSIGGEKYLIDNPLKHSIAKQKIELRFDKWGGWRAFFAKRPIRLVKINRAKKLAA
jgi:transposase